MGAMTINAAIKEAATGGTPVTRHPYGIVPFPLMECKALSPTARLVAVWIESKPKNWIVRPSVIQVALGISEKLWLKARREMVKVGIFRHEKFRHPDGKWEWRSYFDATTLYDSTPPISTHGQEEDIEVRDKEISRQKATAEGICTNAQKPLLPIPADPVSASQKISKGQGIDELKRLHIGYVLNDLGIEWYEEGNHIYWNDYCRARQAEDGHWLYLEVDSQGETYLSGSAIDLIVHEEVCTEREAIARLRRIYNQAIATTSKKQTTDALDKTGSLQVSSDSFGGFR